MKKPNKSNPKTKSCDDNGWPPNTTKYPKPTRPDQGAFPMPPKPVAPQKGAYPMPMPGVAKASKPKK